MSENTRKNLNRVNFFDGQRITEIDLDDEQFYFLNKVNNIAVDFHSSGVLDTDKLKRKILLDTSDPGKYGENLSSALISSGEYDGRYINTDAQPSDSSYGNKLEVELFSSEARGRDVVKVLIIGRVFNSLEQGGDLTLELMEFSKNETKLTKNYFTRINGIIFNNFSGGSGKNSYGNISYSKLGEDGKLIIRESEPLKVFPRSVNIESSSSPDFEMAEFGSSSSTRTVLDEIKLSLTSEDVIGDLFLDLDYKEVIKFEENGNIAKSFGQKFLNKSNNIQSIDIYMGLESGSDWSGEIVFSVYELATELDCITDEDFDRLIDFDPDLIPIAEVSHDKESLEDLGYKISQKPALISFDFSSSFLANPNMSPDLKKEKFYAFMVSRRGDNSSGTILMYKGYDKVYRKNQLSKPLNPIDKYGRQESRFVEFDPAVRRYVDDYSCSLWFRINSSSVEVTDGIFYSESGAAIVLPKVEEYVGSSLVQKSYSHIDLKDLSSGGKNYVVLDEKKNFVDADVHPRTGNFIFTRIQDFAEINVYNSQEYSSLGSLKSVVLGRVIDSNLRSSEFYEGEFDLPGLINEDYFYIINPDPSLITKDLIGKNFVPDTECQCANIYEIIDVKCISSYLGDLNNSKKIDSSDLLDVIELSGMTLSSESTENKILGGEVDIVDFYKSDVNNDGSIDGLDIELLEDALEGSFNFNKPRKFNVLKVFVQSLLPEGEKVIFSDKNNSSISINSSDDIEITLENYKEGLAVRIGDKVVISEGSQDDGVYTIYSKKFNVDTLLLSLSVRSEDGDLVSFSGFSSGNFSIISRTSTNLFSDNLDLLEVPYSSKKFSIYQSYPKFLEEKIDTCDLRRYVEFSFVEVEDLSCLCIEEDCVIEEECDLKTKNQKYLPNDLIISGDILGEDRLPYHGDYEYANISFPLPPGDIEDCKIDLYNAFVKADGSGCLTSYGYPAMRYSDSTYVGCEDTSESNDISKNRIKFLDAIASLYVASKKDTEEGSIILNESFNQFITNYSNEKYYEDFSSWTEDSLNSSSNILINNSSSSAEFSLNTLESPGLRFARLNPPSDLGPLSKDILIDATFARKEWAESSITFGKVKAGIRLLVENSNGTSEIKVGFYKNGSNDTKYFYSAKIFNENLDLIDEYFFEKEIVDDLLEDVTFRIRRINDVVSGYYISKDNLSFIDNIDEQFLKINGRMFRHAGYGDCSFSTFIEQDNAPTANKTFSSILKSVRVSDNLESEERLNEIVSLGRSQSNLFTSSFLVTFPLNIGTSVNLSSASITFVARSSISSAISVNIKTVSALNLDNLDPYYNYLFQDGVTINIGPVSEGEIVSIDVLQLMLSYLSKVGHLPGFNKGFYIELSSLENLSFDVNPNDFNLNMSYNNNVNGETFKVGLDLDKSTGILSISTKNILYDFIDKRNRTVVRVGVLLKKKGFINGDLDLSLLEINAVGIGDCGTEDLVLPGLVSEIDCFSYFIAGLTMPSSPVGGPYNSNLHFGIDHCVESVSNGVATLKSSSVTTPEPSAPPSGSTEAELPNFLEDMTVGLPQSSKPSPWTLMSLNEDLVMWIDPNDKSTLSVERSVIPNKISKGDSSIYNIVLAAKDKSKSEASHDLIIPEPNIENGIVQNTGPTIQKDSLNERYFMRFDGVSNFMEIRNTNNTEGGFIGRIRDRGITVFMVANMQPPENRIRETGSGGIFRSQILSKNLASVNSTEKGDIVASEFDLSIINRASSGGEINSMMWSTDKQEATSLSGFISPGETNIYSFSTFSNPSLSISKMSGFHSNGVKYKDSKTNNFDSENPVGISNQSDEPLFFGGVPEKIESEIGIHTGLNLRADIYEFIVISGEVDEYTRVTIEGYLAHKHGLNKKLTDNHRFKENPPNEETGSSKIL